LTVEFLNVFLPLNKKINAEIVYNEMLTAKNIVDETRVVIWETNII